ncbi:MAG: acetoacetate decarboxylase [Methanospirillum sp.]|nr:acetoacetate decarboxylase [Methanospirillum sp.]
MNCTIGLAGVFSFLLVFILGVCTSGSVSSGNDHTAAAVSMPPTSPAYPQPPYQFKNREYFIITYETDRDLLKNLVPPPLEVDEPVIKYEFIRMPDSSGLGDYTESGQVIPVTYKGKKGLYVLSMYLDNEPAILAGREIWGFPKKSGRPSLGVDPVSRDTLVGRLFYGELEVARGTMGYKWETLPTEDIAISLEETPNYLLKIIPDVDGRPKIRQLVQYRLGNVSVKGAWTGPADLQLFHHALAPVADIPVKRVISGVHFISDLTLLPGTVEYEYPL